MAALLLSLPMASMADSPTTGTIYYTRYGAPAGQTNVNQVTFNYDGLTSFTLTNKLGIATTVGADGIIVGPNGDLLVGGQGNGHVSDVRISDGHITTASPGVPNAYHLALSPDLTKAYTTNIPGNLGFVNLTGGISAGSIITLSGSDTAITSIAFDLSGNGYYTTAGPGGTGSVGRITFSGSAATTTRILTEVPAAHGMVYDSYTNTLDLFGASHITQLNLDTNLTTYSDLNLTGTHDSSGSNFQFDQGAPDGRGHLYVADNNGDILFVNYQDTLHVGDVTNYVDHQFLATTLDDIAPLDGLGSAAATPEPGTFALFGALSLSGLSALVRRLRRRK